jgi:hypothetical protein
MTDIVWDKIGDRLFETGVDRGVLYLPDGSAVPWNGLTSVVEKANAERAPVYFEGRKISDLITLGDYSGEIKAFTYPDEFSELEGLQSVANGLYADDQPARTFGLSYRTRLGNDLEGVDYGYRIHLLYNITAIPTDRQHSSLSDQTTPSEFQWDISGIPSHVPGQRPTAHLVLDARKLDPWLLEDLERMLYGYDGVPPTQPDPEALVSYVADFYIHRIVDHGNGEWSDVAARDELIQVVDEDEELFELIDIDATYLGNEEIEVRDTRKRQTESLNLSDLRFMDIGDGTWKAYIEREDWVSVDEDQMFEIHNANVIFLTPDEYQISLEP